VATASKQFPPAMIATPTFPDLATLVVDESLYIRRILRDMLTRVGLKRLLDAPDGAEALGMLSESKPDLVILDWDLDILSGEEFIRLARTPATSPAPTVPIILMVSKPRRMVVDRALSLGVNEIIAKPFSPKVLWSRLDEVINRPRPYMQVKSLLRPAPRADGGGLRAGVNAPRRLGRRPPAACGRPGLAVEPPRLSLSATRGVAGDHRRRPEGL
jgi:PleD family two-component response regulator